MKKNVIVEYVKEILQALFWVIIFLSIIFPDTLSFWFVDGFNQ